MMNKQFYGPFAKHIQSLIELKRGQGYKYNSLYSFYAFDKFTSENYPNAQELTKEIVETWTEKRSYERDANRTRRIGVIRQLGLYMSNMGLVVYILPKGKYKSRQNYIPHIYSIKELTTFFAATDKCCYVLAVPHRHLIMPLYFRLLYACGLRLSEARLLKVEDVNIEKGILTVWESKNGKSRLIPLTKELILRCEKFHNEVHLFSKKDDYFFPGVDGKPMTIGNVYKNFRRFLLMARISHKGRGEGPRIHDFRHSFACHCLKKIIKEGKDPMVYLPILKTYLGHDSFRETAYYLRLTADIYPDIHQKIESYLPNIIPTLEEIINEKNN